MEYEQATGALEVEALLRRIADDVSKGEVLVDKMTIVPLPELKATVNIEEEPEENLSTVVLNLQHFRHHGGSGAVERELSHPGD